MEILGNRIYATLLPATYNILRWYFEATQLISTMNRSTFVHISVLIIISSATMSSIMAKEIGLIKLNKDYQHDSTDKPINPDTLKSVSIKGM